MPLPVQHASAKVWADEPHVVVNRALYAAKMELAEKILKNHILFQKPGGGFFLWIKMSDLGGGERATERIWKLCGVKMLPGAYLAKEDLGAPREQITLTTMFASPWCMTLRPQDRLWSV